MTTTETDMDVAATSKFDVGDILEFQDDGERVLVTALADSDTLTVIRNFDGSSGAAVGTGTAHTTGVLVAKNPVFGYLQIADAIAESLRDLWPHCYKEVNYSITPVAGQKWYELDDASSNTSIIMELSSVTQVYGVTGQERIMYYGARRGGAYPVNLEFNVPTALAGSAVAIYLPYLRHPTNSVFVNGIARLTAAVDTGNYTDLTEGVEVDTVMYYAMSKLVAWSDIARTTQEDVTMSDESVRPLVRTQLAQSLERQAYENRRKWEGELRIKLPRRQPKAGDGRFER